MSSMSVAMRHQLAAVYLSASEALTHLMLRGRSGPRDFSRVLIVAALGRSNGISSGARLQLAAMRKLAINADLLDATSALRNPMFRLRHDPGSAYIFHVAGPQTANLIASVMPHAAQAYRIGYWAWELPDPPLDWSGCERNLSEIWTPSEFSRSSLARLVHVPVKVVPHYVPVRAARSRSDDAPFTVLAMADSRSSWSRKNPEGAVRAFQLAFGTSSAARLVLKIGGRSKEVDDLIKSLQSAVAGGNVEIVRDHLDEVALAALYRRADVFLSLHRAEGYGIPMAEAMAHGVPVIATGWSGNLDFMSDSDSCLVPYELIEVDDVSAIYRGSKWAEPDVEAAFRFLRRLADQPSEYERLAAAAHRRAGTAAPSFPLT